MKEFGQDMVHSMGKDTTGLGRWCWLKLKGTGSITRVIVAYAACITRKTAQNATIAQQRRYWRENGDKRCPRKIFREQRIQDLTAWSEEGDTLILFINSNENMENGPLQRMLENNDLQLKDIIKTRSNMPGPPTFVRCSR